MTKSQGAEGGAKKPAEWHPPATAGVPSDATQGRSEGHKPLCVIEDKHSGGQKEKNKEKNDERHDFRKTKKRNKRKEQKELPQNPKKRKIAKARRSGQWGPGFRPYSRLPSRLPTSFVPLSFPLFRLCSLPFLLVTTFFLFLLRSSSCFLLSPSPFRPFPLLSSFSCFLLPHSYIFFRSSRVAESDAFLEVAPLLE